MEAEAEAGAGAGRGRAAVRTIPCTRCPPWPIARTASCLLACLQAVGRTRHNKLCYFPGDGAALKGRLVDVHVDRVHAYTLYGRQLD